MAAGQKTYQLTILPPAPPFWSKFGLGAMLQSSIVALLVAIPVFHPEVIAPRRHFQSVTLIAPDLMEHAVPPKVHVKLPPPPKPPETQVAKLEAPPLRPPERKIEAPPVAAPALAKVAPAPKLVRTGLLEGSSAKPTLKLPPRKVQTGGFGDPNGVPPQEHAHGAVEIASLGGFDLPAGKGNGNGTGGIHGVPGTVKSAGWGNGVATGTGGPGGRGGSVQTGGFGNGGIGSGGSGNARAAAQPTGLLPVEILDKPNPIYTAEARRLKVEGEVLLEVDFSANGSLHVVRVVRGLGHGLDEAAVQAAQRIRFKPAQRDGRPTDMVAMLHVVFQLAY